MTLRPLASAALLFTTLFALIVGGLHAQPRTDPVAADLGGCAMPCWNGIVPGSTSREDGLAVVNTITGIEPYHASCYSPPSDMCIHYSWFPGASKTPSAEMAIQQGEIQTVLFYTPGIRLGDLLLALDRLHIDFDGVDENDRSKEMIYIRLLFAHRQVVVNVETDCPGDDLDLMEAPIQTVEVISADMNAFPPPSIDSLAAERQMFARICTLQ